LEISWRGKAGKAKGLPLDAGRAIAGVYLKQADGASRRFLLIVRSPAACQPPCCRTGHTALPLEALPIRAGNVGAVSTKAPDFLRNLKLLKGYEAQP